MAAATPTAAPSSATTSSATKSASSSSSTSGATTTTAASSAADSASSSAAASSVSAAAANASSQAAFTLPGKKLSVLPIGLGVFAGISVIALIVVGLVTYERTKYRKACPTTITHIRSSFSHVLFLGVQATKTCRGWRGDGIRRNGVSALHLMIVTSSDPCSNRERT